MPPCPQTLKPEDLRHIAVLGSGAFGRVTLVEYEGKTYALKTLSKAHIIQTGLQVRGDCCACGGAVGMGVGDEGRGAAGWRDKEGGSEGAQGGAAGSQTSRAWCRSGRCRPAPVHC